MIRIVQKPPLECPDEKTPLCPYTGFLDILEPSHAEIAIQDQIDKLPDRIDKSRMRPLYDLLWLLNGCGRFKTLQCYVDFVEKNNNSRFCFRSEILLNPLNPIEPGLVIDLASVEMCAGAIADLFRSRISEADEPGDVQIVLTPIRSRFGPQEAVTWGYMLGLKVWSFNDDDDLAFQAWLTEIEFVLKALRPQG